MFDWDKIIIDVDDNAVDLTAGEVSLLVGADADTVTWGNITGDITQQPDLMLELDSKIDVDSPEFTGTPRTPTPPAGNSSTRIANTKFVNDAINAVIPVGGFGALASKDTVNYNTEITNKPVLGTLSSKNSVNYDTEVTNKPTLGSLASKNKVNYNTDIENKPTLGYLAHKDTVNYETDVTNKPNIPQTFGTLAAKDSVSYVTEVTDKPKLGALASKDTVNYNTEITNKPVLGTLSSKNSVDYETEVYNKPSTQDTYEYAPAFSIYNNYKIGDYVKYEENIYRFILDHNAREWDPMDVTATHYSKELDTGEKVVVLSDSNSSSHVDDEIREAGAHAITKVHLNYATSGSTTVSETVKTLVISGHKRITARATDGNKITFNGLYGTQYHLDNKFYSIIVEDGAILELEGNITVTHPDSNGILIRRGGMVIYRSVNGSVMNISLPSENYHDGILVESGGKFIADGNIVATRGSTIYQQYPSHVINVSYGAEAHVKGITATNFNYCIGCTGGLASYDSVSGAGVFTASGGRIFTGAQS